MRKDTREFMKEVEELGLTCTVTKKHIKVHDKDGKWVMDMASTPGDTNWQGPAMRRLMWRLGQLYGNSD